MNGTNLFKIALRALNNNKLRAFLTMLGIIIGVASVITMLAIGQGSKKSIQAPPTKHCGMNPAFWLLSVLMFPAPGS